jgi:hypothetical protein
MKCVNHPEGEASALCAICQAPVCEECRVSLRGRDYCRPCLEEKVSTLEGGRTDPNKNAVLALFLSFLPGAGYMYLGLMNRGLQTMVIFFGTIFVAGMTHIDLLIPLVLPVLLFYSIFDTLQLSRQIRTGADVPDKPLADIGGHTNWQNWLGYALIGLGLLALLNNFTPYLIRSNIIQRAVPPAIIIAAGIFFLYTNLRRRDRDDRESNI